MNRLALGMALVIGFAVPADARRIDRVFSRENDGDEQDGSDRHGKQRRQQESH